MKMLLACLLAAVTLPLKAQFINPPPRVAPHLFKVNLLSPGVEYERGVGQNLTINLRAALVPSLAYSYSEDQGGELFLTIDPVVDAQLRYYYNLDERQARGKDIRGNSGSFLALHAGLGGRSVFATPHPQPSYLQLAALWGMQRTYQSGFNLTLYAGPGIRYDGRRSPVFTITSGLRLGWVFKNRQEKEENRVRTFEKGLP